LPEDGQAVTLTGDWTTLGLARRALRLKRELMRHAARPPVAWDLSRVEMLDGTGALFACAGCSLMASKEPAKTDFDFGPLAAARAPDASQSAQANIVVYDITAPAWMDHSPMH
jgi:hypothetical protein